ncbi:helix-turn-helix domain-containing protein [Dyella jiangningensis]|uniref:HTH araC/xylS-type domain-containing protein n=1 Tax=Dyella jiangningensis TaxID=1379159 RepID=A0A328PAL9_9GAMM|nr:helix-turn-helix domain-containing protein [Dyella jiangningensis]RAO78221.1 hypothetical protein CA260_10490 [Dyella jiangningensis]
MKHSFGLEFDAFEEAMRGVDGRYTPVRRHRHDWEMQYLVLGDIEVMVCQNGGGSIYEGSCRLDNFGLFFPLTDIRSLVVDGRDIGKSTLTWLASGKDFTIYNSDVLRWVGISVGSATVNHWMILDPEATQMISPHHLIGNASRAYLAALRDLVARLLAVHEHSPEALSPCTAVKASHDQLARSIQEAMCTVMPPRQKMAGRPRLSPADILRRATTFVDQRMSETVQIADLCKATGVSARTLQKVFTEHFGLGPHRYLMLRRLKAIHETLQGAEPNESIASICSRFGVWDFGRFASCYRQVYGVSPSSTRSGAMH